LVNKGEYHSVPVIFYFTLKLKENNNILNITENRYFTGICNTFIYWLEIFLPNLLLIVRKGDLWFCQALTEAKSYWLFSNETNSSACSQLTVSKYVNARKKTALVDILHLYSMISSKWTMWNNFFFWSRWFLNWSQMYCCQCRNPLGIACVILYCWASRTLITKKLPHLIGPMSSND